MIHASLKPQRAAFILKAITLCVAFLSLTLPTIQMSFNLVPTTAVTENRVKAKLPTNFTSILNPNSTFSSDYERYFNDNFGFRDLLIRVKNQFDYSLFTFSSQVHIGPHKWLFYKDTYESTVLSLEKRRPEMPKLIARMRRLKDLLAERGITLIVVPCPMKTTMYSEELPKLDVQSPAFSAFDEYREFLGKEPGIVTIDVKEALLELKKKMPTYHRTDFHWNDPAGAQVLNDMLTAMERSAGLPISTKPPVKIRIEPRTGGGEINSLAVIWPPYEDMLMLEAPLYTSTGTFADSGKSNTWTYTTNNPSDPSLLPPTVLFGDSFADAFLRAGFTGRFKEMRKFYNLEFKDKFSEIPPGTKFVVLEHIESNLGAMLLDSYWPKELQ